jgi:TonB family protein
MLLVPIVEAGTPCGIVEVFSSFPNNFGDKDVKMLQSLATRIVEAKNVSESGISEPSSSDAESAPPERAGESVPEAKTTAEQESIAVASHSVPEGARKYDVLTSALVVLVIAAAVLLGLIIGVRETAKRAAPDRPVPTKNEPATHPPSASEQVTSQADSGAFSSAPATSPPHKVGTPVGGLIVTQNGKVIYRADASKPSEQSADGSQSAEPGRLMHRVDPEYPEAAKSQRIQGPVVLDAQVLSDGSVGNIAVVEGNPLLTDAATQAVKQWKYQPFIVNGRPVERQERITLKFRLPSS